MADEKKLSYDELLEQLKDPSILHAVAAKHGMKVVKDGEEKVEVPPVKKAAERPKFSLPKDASTEDMISGLVGHIEKLTDYYENIVASKTDEVRGEFKTFGEQQLLKEVRTFAKSHKHFDELVPIIQPLVSSGKYTLEEAYGVALKSKGLTDGEPAKGEKSKEEKPPEKKISSFKSTDEGGTPPTELKSKVKSVRDAASQNLSKILADLPDGEAALNDEVDDGASS